MPLPFDCAQLSPAMSDKESLAFDGAVQHSCWCACSRDPEDPCGDRVWRAGAGCAWCDAVRLAAKVLRGKK